MNERQQTELVGLVDALDASEDVRELAQAFAYRAFALELHERRSVTEVLASAVYAAFRRAGNAHSLAEVAAVAEVPPATIGRAYSQLSDDLDIALAPADPHEFVSRFAAAFDVSARVEETASEIVEESIEAGLLSGVVPAGVAAGALYLAGQQHNIRLNQDEIAEVAGITSVTLRHRYAEQAELLGVDEHGKIPRHRRPLFE